MSPWLKPRLLALFGTAALCGASYLHAQGSYPAPAKTPQEAATAFYRYLSSNERRGDATNTNEAEDNPAAPPLFYGPISRAQAVNFSGRPDQIRPLFDSLARELNEPRFEAKAGAAQSGQTLVRVSPVAAGTGREVVVIPEDGGYRVDLKATYARWNDLSGLALDEAWWKYTGIVSPALASDGNFLNSNCQSNLKQLGLAIAQYVQDYDEVMPPVRRWQNDDVLSPYLRNREAFHCPALNKGSGYAFNSKLSRTSLAGIRDAASTIELYETSNPALNVFAPFTGRAYRHIQEGKDGMNICFADGHVKWFARGTKANSLTIEPEAPANGLVSISTTTP